MASGSQHTKAEMFLRGPFNRRVGDTTSDDQLMSAERHTLTTNVAPPPFRACSEVTKNGLSPLDPLKSVAHPSSPLDSRVLDESTFEATGGHATTTSGFFSKAKDFVVNNPSMIDKSMTVNYYNQGRLDQAAISKAIKLLFKHIIEGAAHDSSARDPPPRCHPGTRIEINGRILLWFHDADKRERLLWIYGHAGVGKSAIVQTIADELSSSKLLGASVFISRPRNRNDSTRLFITIAYQLAEHIAAYRTYIASKLDTNPELVNKALKEQFQISIVEPFVEGKVGVDGKSWGILLDGLDELDEQRAQRDVIHLITTFVLEYPQVPLVWVIASRQEPHISVAFEGKKIATSYWKEGIPVDSFASCQDVERYLNDSFETMRNEFSLTVPKHWPGAKKVWELASAASGLFAFASVAIGFIADGDYANPVTRLDEILSDVRSSEDRPFANLDALYTRILNKIPSRAWPTTKRVFCVLLYCETNHMQSTMGTLAAISILLGLEFGAVYASLYHCLSVLKIPPRELVYDEPIAFYHASFGDYLKDATRSEDFHIPVSSAEDEVQHALNKLSRDLKA